MNFTITAWSRILLSAVTGCIKLAQKLGQQFITGVQAELIFKVVVLATKDLFYLGVETILRI